MPHPITRTWELMCPIPHWILNFFHIEGGLIIRIKVTISAHNPEEFYNTFCCEISFAQYSHLPFPHHIEESEIVFGYLWPNPYYQEELENIIHALSRVSLATGVTASVSSTWLNSPSPPSSLELAVLPPSSPEP